MKLDMQKLSAQLGAAIEGPRDHHSCAEMNYIRHDSAGNTLTYRTWLPDTTLTVVTTAAPQGGLTVSCKLDHVRGGAGQDDHAVLIAMFNEDGALKQAQASIQFEGAMNNKNAPVQSNLIVDTQNHPADIPILVMEDLRARMQSSYSDSTAGRVYFADIVGENLEAIRQSVVL